MKKAARRRPLIEARERAAKSERVLGAERVRRVARQAVAALHANVGVQVGALAERVVVADRELAAVVVGARGVEAVVSGLQRAGADRGEGTEAPELVGR